MNYCEADMERTGTHFTRTWKINNARSYEQTSILDSCQKVQNEGIETAPDAKTQVAYP